MIAALRNVASSVRLAMLVGGTCLAIGTAAGGYGAHVLGQARYATLELQLAQAQMHVMQERQVASNAAAAKLQADLRAGEAIAALAVAEDIATGTTFNQIRKVSNLAKETSRKQGRPDIDLPLGWVRQYNAAVSASPGQSPPPTSESDGEAERTGSAQGANQFAPSGLSQWDVLDNATDNAEGYAACRRQLNRLIDWVEATTK